MKPAPPDRASQITGRKRTFLTARADYVAASVAKNEPLPNETDMGDTTRIKREIPRGTTLAAPVRPNLPNPGRAYAQLVPVLKCMDSRTKPGFSCPNVRQYAASL